jgi:hypothetical protein
MTTTDAADGELGTSATPVASPEDSEDDGCARDDGGCEDGAGSSSTFVEGLSTAAMTKQPTPTAMRKPGIGRLREALPKLPAAVCEAPVPLNMATSPAPTNMTPAMSRPTLITVSTEGPRHTALPGGRRAYSRRVDFATSYLGCMWPAWRHGRLNQIRWPRCLDAGRARCLARSSGAGAARAGCTRVRRGPACW